MDEEEAQDLRGEIFTKFTLRHADLDFSIYFPVKDRNDAKLLTLNMLIESAKAGRWLYDWYISDCYFSLYVTLVRIMYIMLNWILGAVSVSY